MTSTLFETGCQLIYVGARVFGRRGYRDVQLALDTGATYTSLQPDVAESLGYDAHDAVRRTRSTLPAGIRRGYLLDVRRFEALGYGVEALRVNVVDLGTKGIEGLIGLSFLNCFNYEVRSIEGRILVERAA